MVAAGGSMCLPQSGIVGVGGGVGQDGIYLLPGGTERLTRLLLGRRGSGLWVRAGQCDTVGFARCTIGARMDAVGSGITTGDRGNGIGRVNGCHRF